MLIDTHCHLDFSDFDEDREEVIKAARDGGVKKIINIGCFQRLAGSLIALDVYAKS